jgi:hypothetical protein
LIQERLMKRFVRLCIASLTLVACSDPTEPAGTLDTNPVFARGGKPAPGGGASGGPTTVALDDTHTFELNAPSTSSTFGTEIQPGVTAIASDPVITEAPSGERFLGRFEETRTLLVLTTPTAHPKYALDLDLYIIGSWDGKGKQAQQGAFLANIVEIGYRCGGSSTINPLYSTTFSNQLTVQQDYPQAFGLGGNKAGTSSIAKDALEYITRPDLSNTPLFRSFGDVSYRLSFAGANPCGAAAVSFVWGTSNPTQQSMHDESWGLDNVRIRLGS